MHVGTPPGPLSDWVIKKVHFHGFEGLPTTRGEEVKSPEFSCFGHQWTVAIYPGGVKVSNEGGVAIFLVSESPESIQADYKIVMKHPIDQAKKTYGEAAGRHVEEDQMPSDGPPLRHLPCLPARRRRYPPERGGRPRTFPTGPARHSMMPPARLDEHVTCARFASVRSARSGAESASRRQRGGEEGEREEEGEGGRRRGPPPLPVNAERDIEKRKEEEHDLTR